MRKTKEELEKIKQEYGVSELYSWSKINTFMTSPYEYYLSYVLHKKPDIDNCAYAPLGGMVHQIIENYYNGKTEYNKMTNEFDDVWTTMIDIANLKFDRNTEEKNESIKRKYKEDLEHFFKTHQSIPYKIIIEQFTTAKIGDYVLQGYIDAVYKDNEGFYHIIDWKTSSKYGKESLKVHSGQLTVYAISLMQKGIPLEKIKAGFNFLKYCTVEYTQANGSVKSREIERSKIGESLQSNTKMWLKKLGYTDEVDNYLKLLCDTNDINCLPEDVKNKYRMYDCYVYIDLTEKSINEWTEKIIATIRDIKTREKDYHETKSEMVFWDSDSSVEKNSFYFATLCGFSSSLHKPYKAYLDRLEEKKNGNDLFANVGVDVNRNETITSKIQKQNSEIDLSWLDALV